MAYKDYSNLKEEYTVIINYCRNLNEGDKIKFETERQRYTVKAKSDRYLICTKPFNLIHHCLYTIIDLHRLVRGPNSLIFNCYDYQNQQDIEKCLYDLETEKIEVSHRRAVRLDVEMQ